MMRRRQMARLLHRLTASVPATAAVRAAVAIHPRQSLVGISQPLQLGPVANGVETRSQVAQDADGSLRQPVDGTTVKSQLQRQRALRAQRNVIARELDTAETVVALEVAQRAARPISVNQIGQ